eukprot:7514868-Heterocapsa_arctica.AAC.1
MSAPSQASKQASKQCKTGTADVGVWMEDTMDRPNDPGGLSSSSPIIIVPDVPKCKRKPRRCALASPQCLPGQRGPSRWTTRTS